MAIDPFTIGLIGSGIGALGSLFAPDRSKQQAEQQRKMMEAQWRRQDQQRPFQSALFQNPVMQQRMNLGMNNNNFNWSAFQNQMSPQMLQLLRTVSPQFSGQGFQPQQQPQQPPRRLPPGGFQFNPGRQGGGQR